MKRVFKGSRAACQSDNKKWGMWKGIRTDVWIRRCALCLLSVFAVSGTAQGSTVTNLQISLSATTQGTVRLEILWPASFTNRLDLLSAAALPDTVWQLEDVNIPTIGFTSYEWTDWAATHTAERFYRVSNADLDSDGDTLSNGLELYVFGSNPYVKDSDSDGLSDDIEVGSAPPSDPSNGDREAPLVAITGPKQIIVVVP